MTVRGININIKMTCVGTTLVATRPQPAGPAGKERRRIAIYPEMFIVERCNICRVWQVNEVIVPGIRIADPSAASPKPCQERNALHFRSRA